MICTSRHITLSLFFIHGFISLSLSLLFVFWLSFRPARSYLGLVQPRLKGDQFFSVMDEFIKAVTERWPRALIQVRRRAVRRS